MLEFWLLVICNFIEESVVKVFFNICFYEISLGILLSSYRFFFGGGGISIEFAMGGRYRVSL